MLAFYIGLVLSGMLGMVISAFLGALGLMAPELAVISMLSCAGITVVSVVIQEIE